MRGVLERRPLLAAVSYTVMGVLPLYLTAAQSVAIQRELGFGPGRFGLVVSGFFLASSIGATRVGARIDTDGASRGLRRAAILVLVSTLATTFAVRGWAPLALALAVAGLANAYGQVGSNAVIAHLVPRSRQAVAFSAKQSAIPLSAVISGIVVPLLGPSVEWRWAYLGIAAFAAVLWASVPAFEAARAIPAGASATAGASANADSGAGAGTDGGAGGRARAGANAAAPAPGGGETGARGGRVPLALGLLVVAGGLAGGTGNATAAFTPDAAVAAGFAPSVAALLLTAGSLTAIVVRVSAGFSADRRAGNGAAETLTLLCLGAAGLAVLTLTGSSRVSFLVGLLLAFVGAWGWQGVIAVMALRSTDLSAGTATGYVWSGVYAGTVVVPSAVGFIAERSSYTAAFAGQTVLMALAAVCVGTSWWLTYGRRAVVRA